MGAEFTPREESVLCGLLAEATTDIILKTDREGFILHASPMLERLGVALPSMLIGPHLLDLVHPSHTDTIKADLAAAIGGKGQGQWTEFPGRTEDDQPCWFEIQMRALSHESGDIYGTLAILRCLETKRNMEEELFASSMTDPLTGLANRSAFIAMLEHLVQKDCGGCVALFDIDHFRAINLQHGQTAGDRVLVVFSDFLRTFMREDDIISRIGGESVGVLLPRTTPDQAEAICRRIIGALSEIRDSVGEKGISITASTGIARIASSLDDTMKRAELALFFAKAKGRNRLEMDGNAMPAWLSARPA